MEKKPNLNTDEWDGSYAFDMQNEFNSIASATECTGLMPTPPQNEDEAESYSEIYVVPKVENERERELKK